MSTAVQRFRFRPRFRGVAWLAVALGATLLASALVTGGSALVWVTGVLGVGFGLLYIASPTWRLAVIVDDEAVEVASGAVRRFRLPWPDVVQVVASPSTRTCFVDGGDPARSLLVPGDGAPAPYAIEDRAALYDAIVSRVPADRIVEVDVLERHKRG